MLCPRQISGRRELKVVIYHDRNPSFEMGTPGSMKRRCPGVHSPRPEGAATTILHVLPSCLFPKAERHIITYTSAVIVPCLEQFARDSNIKIIRRHRQASSSGQHSSLAFPQRCPLSHLLPVLGSSARQALQILFYVYF